MLRECKNVNRYSDILNFEWGKGAHIVLVVSFFLYSEIKSALRLMTVDLSKWYDYSKKWSEKNEN